MCYYTSDYESGALPTAPRGPAHGSKVYTDEGSRNSIIMVCPSVREIINELKLVDYLSYRWTNLHIRTASPLKRKSSQNYSQNLTIEDPRYYASIYY